MTVDETSNSTRSRLRKLLSSRREEVIESQYNEIKQLETKYRRLYDGSPEMYRTINLEGIIIDCNQSYVTNLGYSDKDEVIGHSIFEHTAKESLDAMRESFEEWRGKGLVRDKEVWLKRKDRSTFSVLVNANNLYDDNENLVGSNTVITDVTEICRARKQLEKANEQLRKAYEMEEEFLRIAAHELRTPIQPILGYATLAKRRMMNQEEALDGVIKEARRLKQLADDILDVSRIGSGSLTYDMQKVRINEIITEVISSARLALQQSGTRESVIIEAKLEDDSELCIDGNRIAQALANIVNNSVKFTTKGRITIETCVLREKKLLEIKISDTGTGIPQEILFDLFGKFVTRTTGHDANNHGTGLGLFITKSIIQAHGGDVFGYNNEHSPGATFVIRLPMQN